MHVLLIKRTQSSYNSKLLFGKESLENLKKESDILISQGWKLIHSMFDTQHFVIYILEK